MFLKLKASLSPLPKTDDGDKETRRRHRLSKPLTNKSSANLLTLSPQQSEVQASNSNGINITPASLSASASCDNVVEAVQSPPFYSTPDVLQDRTLIVKEEGWKGAAFILGGDPYQDDDSPTLLSPRESIKARRPLSAIFAPQFSGSRTAGDNARRRTSLQVVVEGGSQKAEKNKPAAILSSSSETQSDALSPRLQRRSSFTPGVATRTFRKPSLGPSPGEEQANADRDRDHYPVLSEESPHGRLEVLDFDEEWAPPAPPVARSETPSDLDYTHLGGLRLGSLRVVNGRASPAPSELSRHLTAVTMPTLKRDASSNYGDGEEENAVSLASLRINSYRGRDRGLQDFVPVTRRPVAAPARTQSDNILLPKRNHPNGHTSNRGAEANSSWTPAPKVDTPSSLTASQVPDKTSQLAMAYMAELSANPYTEERPISPTGSVLKPTSKATEFDDNLFEDEDDNLSISEEANHLSPDTHCSSNDAVWMYENAYRLSVKRSRDTSPRSSLQPSNSTGSSASITPDSGYGSKISLQSTGNRTRGAGGKIENPVPNGKATQVEAVHLETCHGGSEPRPRSMPPRPSILKRNAVSAVQLPSFPNLYSSTTTLATIKSTSSAPSDAPAKSRKLQKRPRPRSQPPPVRQIVIQGQHRDVSNGDIPPIPTEIAANLAIRTQQVPELGHTFSSMDHTREIESSPKAPCAPTYVDFPNTDPNSHDPWTEVNLPTPPPHRSSFIKWSKSEKRHSERAISNVSGISEDDAMVIIHDLDTAVSSMGGSPYDVTSRRPTTSLSRRPLSQTPINLHNPTRESSRPKPMMDDATAAELARLRSRTIVERDDMQWKERRSSFNDRGGIPGRNIRPLSTAGDAPPLPPLPSNAQVRQREVRQPDYQRPYPETCVAETKYWPEQFSSDPYESVALPLPSRPPPPRPTELQGDVSPLPPSHSPQRKSMETRENSLAPPPPSHSPRPRSIPSADGLVAPPPPAHSPRPASIKPQEEVPDIWAAQASAWKSRRKSIGEMLRAQTLPTEEQYHGQPLLIQEPAIDDPIYPEIPWRRPQKSFTTGPEEYRNSGLQFHGAQLGSISREPPRNEPPQPPPQFGRYSGGLTYGHEYGAGFGGSAGTASGSLMANATGKGVPLGEDFGIDLSDVPIVAGIRRKPVGFH